MMDFITTDNDDFAFTATDFDIIILDSFLGNIFAFV